MKQIVRSIQSKSQFRFLKFLFPLSKLKNIWLGFFLRVKGYPISSFSSTSTTSRSPNKYQMKVDAPANAKSNIAPDYDSDSEQMEKDDKNESVVVSDSESVVLDSAKLMPTFYPQTTLNPNPQDEITGSSGIIQIVPYDQTGIIEKRIAVCDLILEIKVFL